MRRILSLLVVLSLAFSFQVFGTQVKTAQAAYGTPVIDGVRDEIWDATNKYAINNPKEGGFSNFIGVFSALWDEDNLYFYIDVYDDILNADGALPWNTDCVEIFIDEKNEKNKKYDDNDYQLRVNKDNVKSGLGRGADTFYSEVKITDFGYSVEAKIPMISIKPSNNRVIGLDLQITDMLNETIKRSVLGWNSSSHTTSSDASLFGELIMRETVNVKEFKMPNLNDSNKNFIEKYNFEKTAVNYIDVYIDGRKSELSSKVIESDYLPCLPVIEYMRLLGANVEDMNGSASISLNGNVMTVSPNERIAKLNERHAMLDVPPFINEGVLYIPASAVSWLSDESYVVYEYQKRVLDITTRAPLSNDEIIIYAKDFGAKGNNTGNDYPAVQRAIDSAIASGKRATVMLEEGAVYRFAEKMGIWPFFVFNNVENITLDGRGAKIIIETPTNTFLEISECYNVQVKNIEIIYEELPYVQGTVTEIFGDTRSFNLLIDEGYPDLPPDEWAKKYNGEDAWFFGTLFDPIKPHRKWSAHDHNMIEAVNNIGGRLYNIKLPEHYAHTLSGFEINDRYVYPVKQKNYALSRASKSGSTHNILIDSSRDCLIEGIINHHTLFFWITLSHNSGRIVVRNSKLVTIEGSDNLLAGSSDGIHVKGNIIGPIIEGCSIESNLDDSINISTMGLFVTDVISDKSFSVASDSYAKRIKSGDIIWLFSNNGSTSIEKARVVNTSESSGSVNITVDKEVKGLTLGADYIYNATRSGAGYIIRNNTFHYGRRYAILMRAPYGRIESNTVFETGSDAILLGNETGSFEEGPVPCGTTIYGNTIINSNGYAVNARIVNPEKRKIPNGLLLESNIFDETGRHGAVSISMFSEITMLNNKVIMQEGTAAIPISVLIMSGGIDKIDGLEGVNVGGDMLYYIDQASTFSESDITNIKK